MTSNLLQQFNWRHAVLLSLLLFPLVLLLMIDPIPQDEAYHRFIDTDSFLGIPNFLDVLSNLAFLLVGALGIAFCLKNHTGPG
ncbi:MAG: hypothetical protein AB2699_18685, partial [Candidatus Thiodiazotropha taylori]